MRIFFDVNGTLVGEHGLLRPHAREVLEKLKADGNDIYLWSALGPRWDIVEQHQLTLLVSGCFIKPTLGRAPWLGVMRMRGSREAKPDLCVDDTPMYVKAFGGVLVRRYHRVNAEDRELPVAYDAISKGAWQRAQLWQVFFRTIFPGPWWNITEPVGELFRRR